MTRIFALVLCFVVFSEAAAGEKAEKIKRLLDVSGTGTMLEAVLKTLPPPSPRAVVGNDPAITDAMLAAVGVEIQASMAGLPQQLFSMVIPLYERHYSGAEIDDMIAFYQTPTGEKLAKTGPRIIQETQLLGMVLAARLASDLRTRVAGRLAQMGYAPKQTASPPADWSVSPELVPRLRP